MSPSLRFGSSMPRDPTRLLVSVASAAEVEPAIAGGADIVDVKDPSAGALGRASPQSLREVVACVAGFAPVTAAWGELAEALPLGDDERESLRGVNLIKLGTAQLGQEPAAWSRHWQSIHDSLPAGIAIAIVHYADWERAGALDLESTLTLATEANALAVVIDTHGKLGGCLLDFYPPPKLRAVVQQIRDRQREVVLAGSLQSCHLPTVLQCAPGVVGVRGAACRQGDREGPICRQQVAALKAALRGHQRQGHCVPAGNTPFND